VWHGVPAGLRIVRDIIDGLIRAVILNEVGSVLRCLLSQPDPVPVQTFLHAVDHARAEENRLQGETMFNITHVGEDAA